MQLSARRGQLYQLRILGTSILGTRHGAAQAKIFVMKGPNTQLFQFYHIRKGPYLCKF